MASLRKIANVRELSIVGSRAGYLDWNALFEERPTLRPYDRDQKFRSPK